MTMQAKIIGIGAYIPSEIQSNNHFLHHQFLDTEGTAFESENAEIIEKFTAITGIRQRRYAPTELNASDLAFFAAEKAIDDAKIDPENLDYIIVAHNFGDVAYGSYQSDMLPSLASRVKHLLRIQNPSCVAYDLLFGCPGWIEGVIQANAFIKSGMAKNCLIIGAETLSRIVDKHDRDSMIYGDGAGAVVLSTSEGTGGVIRHQSASYTYDEAFFLFNGDSYNKNVNSNTKYIKMYGRKIYEFACTYVPTAMKECLDNSGIDISEVKKILIHQANQKMDEAIVKRFYKLYDRQVPDNVMPMCIEFLGNSSVATVPTLLDLIVKGNLENQQIHSGDVVIFASVGAGMNINALVYRF